MRAGAKAIIAVILFSGLSGCSSVGSLFSYDTARPAHTAVAEPDSPPGNGGCAHIAGQRADDAVMAGYVNDGSSGRAQIYDATYRDCAERQGR